MPRSYRRHPQPRPLFPAVRQTFGMSVADAIAAIRLAKFAREFA